MASCVFHAAGAAALAAALSDSAPRLTFLDISGNALGPDGAAALAPALRSLAPSLTSFSVSCNQLFRAGTAVLAPALACMTALTHLNFTHNRLNEFGVLGAAVLAPVMLAIAPSLLSLHLSWNYFGCDDGTEAAALAPALASPIGSMHALEELHLEGNKLGPACTAALAPALSCIAPSLTLLDISRNQLRPAGAATLASALAGMTAPTHLPLFFNNNLGPDGAAALPPALPVNAPLALSLSTLRICNNQLGSDGAAALAPALSSMHALAELYIGGNGLGTAGAEALALALFSIAPSLTCLDISDNQLRDDDTVALAPALGRMTALQQLAYASNFVGAAGAASLASVLPAMGQLQYLGMAGACFQFEGLRALAAGLLALHRHQHWTISIHHTLMANNTLVDPADDAMLTSIMDSMDGLCVSGS